MKKCQYQFICFFILFAVQITPTALAEQLAIEPLWQSNNAYLLHGSGYDVDTSEQTTLTLEHFSAWSAGDIFFFVDLTKFHGSNQANGLYGELSPRLSLSYLSGKSLDTGLFKDFFVATTFEYGKGDVGSFLIGPGFDFNLPGFDYFSLNVYQRFINSDRDGETVQITPVWGMSGELWHSKVTFEGYIDWNINNDGNYHRNFHFNPRLKYDLGNMLNIEQDKATLGLEYSYWKNKYGIKSSSNFDTNQSALSVFLNYQL